jgi:murein DD-endopeptidase MepM/ murein hydrolase activator NlpD
MRKLKEVLRLHSLGLSQHQIARSCSISQSTVHEYLSAAQAAGVRWPLPDNWDEQQIEQALFPQRPAPSVWRKHPEPDWGKIHEDLQTHKDLTLQLAWQEGRESNPDGYGYSRYVVAIFMLLRNAEPQALCSSTSPTATLIGRLPGL